MPKERGAWQGEDKRDYGTDDLGFGDQDDAGNETHRSRDGPMKTSTAVAGGAADSSAATGASAAARNLAKVGPLRPGLRPGSTGLWAAERLWRLRFGPLRPAGPLVQLRPERPYRQGPSYEGGSHGGNFGNWRYRGGEEGSDERGYAGSRGGYYSSGMRGDYGMGGPARATDSAAADRRTATSGTRRATRFLVVWR